MGPRFVEDLPVGRFHGVGPATVAKMEGLGIHTGRDLRERTLAFLQERFGKAGPYYFSIARGIDERPVRANRVRKSIGAENTFSENLFAFDAMREALQPIADKVWRACEAKNLRGRTVTLKVKYADFQQITRSQSRARAIACRADLDRAAVELLGPLMPVPKGVRLLGLTVSSFAADQDGAEAQFTLPL